MSDKKNDKPRFLTNGRGVVFPWSEHMANAAGMIECDHLGKPLNEAEKTVEVNSEPEKSAEAPAKKSGGKK